MIRAGVPLTTRVPCLRFKGANSTSQSSKTNPPKPMFSRVNHFLFLQRTLGNRAVGRLFECEPALDGTQRTEPSRQTARIQRAASPQAFHCPDFAGDAKLEACLNNKDRLRPGDEGPSVQKVQRALLNDDVFIGPEGADGKFGPNTAQGVMAFKAKHHLGSTEFPDVGPRTMGKLDELCGGGLPPLPACKFIVRYGNERQGSACGPPGCLCNPNACGGGIQFDILEVKASGAACPPSLAGLQVTEQVTTDAGCLAVPPPITGTITLDASGRPVGGATDTYRLCFPRRLLDLNVMFIVGECTQTMTQRVFVGGILADTRTIKFRVLFRGDLSAPDFLRC